MYIVAEIGINHNGELEIAKRLIDAAVAASCDAVKFQKRTPELATPPDQRDVMRETPWGAMSYIEYRHRVELDENEYEQIDAYCRESGIAWFASVWDEQALAFIDQFETPCIKVPSAALTNDALLRATDARGVPIVVSTGMSTLEQVDHAVQLLDSDRLLLLHANSSYPCDPADLNLRTIETLRTRYGVPIGYSGHEVGLQTTLAAVALGACLVERHITLDRAMWGTDQAASVEPHGFERLVRDIRVIEAALGDGVKRVYDSELPAMRKLRLVP